LIQIICRTFGRSYGRAFEPNPIRRVGRDAAQRDADAAGREEEQLAMGDERQTQAGRAALACLARGWSVIPVKAFAKRPIVRWEPFQNRLPTREEVEGWFRRWPDANLGIVTGAISGLVVLDVDPRHGGEDSLSQLEEQHEVLPETVEAMTGGGGRHLYFAHPGGSVPNKVALAPGIDLRGDGGMVVAPPSRHPSGQRYIWEVSHDPDDVAPAPVPPWLVALLQRDVAHPGHALGYWRALVRRGVDEGERNNTVASLTGHLLWHEVDPEVVMELLLCWNRVRCRPPLDDEEVARTVESVTRTHQRHRAEAAED
jgi:hypothetical protein